MNFDLGLTGFSAGEIDIVLLGANDPDDDHLPEIKSTPRTRPDDIWILGDHRLGCGDGRDRAFLRRVIGKGVKIDAAFLDPPYNVAIGGHANTRGRHREFAMASGEMSGDEFRTVLTDALGACVAASRDGAVHFVCMDWRHMDDLSGIGRDVYGDLLNLCIWNKSNAGMGSLYRSKHELIFVYRVGQAPHFNAVELGKHGRNRTNVWDYASVNTIAGSRREDLKLHPTVKPTALVADAIQDVTRRGDLVLARILPAFGRMPLDRIGPEDVAAWFDAASRDKPGAANRALEILRSMMFRAEEWGLRERDSNPCLGIARNPRNNVARFLEAEELARLGRALDAHEARWPEAVAAIRLLALTGCRRSEVLNLRWRDIGADAINLPDSKTGPRAVPLGEAAWAHIAALPGAREADAFLFARYAEGRGAYSLESASTAGAAAAPTSRILSRSRTGACAAWVGSCIGRTGDDRWVFSTRVQHARTRRPATAARQRIVVMANIPGQLISRRVRVAPGRIGPMEQSWPEPAERFNANAASRPRPDS